MERRATRRRVALEELVPVGGDVAAAKALVARLASAGLLVTIRSTPAASSGAVPEGALSPQPAATEHRERIQDDAARVGDRPGRGGGGG